MSSPLFDNKFSMDPDADRIVAEIAARRAMERPGEGFNPSSPELRQQFRPQDAGNFDPSIWKQFVSQPEQAQSPGYERENITGLGSLFDAPRSALWNMGRGISDAFSGKAPDARDILPGLLGLGIAGISAPFGGIPAALLLGSLGAGATQAGAGNKAMAPDEFTGGPVSGALLSILTDPLTYAGAGIARGAIKGTQPLGQLGRAADSAVQPLVSKIADAGYARSMPGIDRGLEASRLAEQAPMMRSTPSAGLQYHNFRDPSSSIASAMETIGSGKLSSLDELVAAQRSLEDAGVMSRSLGAGSQNANQVLGMMERPAMRNVIEAAREPGAVNTTFPAGRSIKTRTPEVQLGRPQLDEGGGGMGMQLGEYQPRAESILQGNVPLPQEELMAAIQQDPALLKKLIAEAQFPEGAAGTSAFKMPQTQQKYLSQILSEMLSGQSAQNYRGLIPGG